jgi:ribosomal protein S6
MQVYELGYLILPSIAEGELSDVATKLEGVIAKAGGKELDSEAPEKIDLAYPMEKTVGASRYVVNDAYIGWIKFEMEPASVEEVKSAVDSTDEVLRSLLIKAPRETTFTFAAARKAAEEKDIEKSADAPILVIE